MHRKGGLKIALLGHPDIASLYAHDRLVRSLPGHEFTLFLSPAIAPGENTHPALAELDTIDRSMVEAFDAGFFHADGASQSIKSSGGKLLTSPNTDAGLSLLRAAAPDLIISIRYRKILKDAAIAIPPLGVLNLHSGILPDFRGVMATFWAMLEGAPEIGTTLHGIVDSGIDTGPTVSIQRRAVDRQASYLDNVLALYPDGVEAIALAVERLAAGDDLPLQRTPSGGQYYSTPDAENVQAFLNAGLRFSSGIEPSRLKQAVSNPVR